MNEGKKTGEIRDFSEELTIVMFYQAGRAVTSFIPDSDSSQDENKIIKERMDSGLSGEVWLKSNFFTHCVSDQLIGFRN
ncbi:hypothetical protein ACSAZL_18640 [Methanosarcina sp. T3]|uniref:hypothetical protein n=1 Tax=Methanosarcina sp. T3 TaxID=3439062 RepID=UPI003F87D798